MNQPGYTDEQAAALYDVLNPWGEADDFFFGFIMGATDVLDVGCGNGSALKRARRHGHTGTLVGIDPDLAALAIARPDTSIEWREGRASGIADVEAFDVAVMMSNAFQFITSDDDVSASLRAIHRSLRSAGHFVFDTRTRSDHAWEQWTPENEFTVTDPDGSELLMYYDIMSVDLPLVTISENTCDASRNLLRSDVATMRFWEPDELNRFLTSAGFEIEQQFGAFDLSPLTDEPGSIVTVARKTSP